MPELEVVRQRDNWDCAIATTAIVTAHSYDTVYDKAIELFGENIIGYGIHSLQEFQLLVALDFNGIQVIGDRPDNTIAWITGRTYLVCVPSISNPVFKLHRIVVQCTEDTKLKILDPSEYYETIDFTVECPHILGMWEVCYAEDIN